jgi:hypothetical protein
MIIGGALTVASPFKAPFHVSHKGGDTASKNATIHEANNASTSPAVLRQPQAGDLRQTCSRSAQKVNDIGLRFCQH